MAGTTENNIVPGSAESGVPCDENGNPIGVTVESDGRAYTGPVLKIQVPAEVEAIQIMLESSGIDVGGPDGIFGTKSTNGLTQYLAEAQARLKAEGKYDGEINGEYTAALGTELLAAENITDDQRAGLEALAKLQEAKAGGYSVLDTIYQPSAVKLTELDPACTGGELDTTALSPGANSIDPSNQQVTVYFGPQIDGEYIYARVFDSFEAMNASDLKDWKEWRNHVGLSTDVYDSPYRVEADNGETLMDSTLDTKSNPKMMQLIVNDHQYEGVIAGQHVVTTTEPAPLPPPAPEQPSFIGGIVAALETYVADATAAPPTAPSTAPKP